MKLSCSFTCFGSFMNFVVGGSEISPISNTQVEYLYSTVSQSQIKISADLPVWLVFFSYEF